jgi:hypothetical protein
MALFRLMCGLAEFQPALMMYQLRLKLFGYQTEGLPLTRPIDYPRNLAEIPFGDSRRGLPSIAAVEESFLYIRGKVEKVHKLRQASSCDVTQAGNICIVDDFTAVD